MRADTTALATVEGSVEWTLICRLAETAAAVQRSRPQHSARGQCVCRDCLWPKVRGDAASETEMYEAVSGSPLAGTRASLFLGMRSPPPPSWSGSSCQRHALWPRPVPARTSSRRRALCRSSDACRMAAGSSKHVAGCVGAIDLEKQRRHQVSEKEVCSQVNRHRAPSCLRGPTYNAVAEAGY